MPSGAHHKPQLTQVISGLSGHCGVGHWFQVEIKPQGSMQMLQCPKFMNQKSSYYHILWSYWGGHLAGLVQPHGFLPRFQSGPSTFSKAAGSNGPPSWACSSSCRMVMSLRISPPPQGSELSSCPAGAPQVWLTQPSSLMACSGKGITTAPMALCTRFATSRPWKDQLPEKALWGVCLCATQRHDIISMIYPDRYIRYDIIYHFFCVCACVFTYIYI